MTTTPFISLTEIKQHITSEIYGTTFPDDALQRVLDMCEADVLMHAGNHLGVVFSQSVLNLRFQCHSSTEWLQNFGAIVGNPVIAGTSVALNSMSWTVPSGGVGRITATGREIQGSSLGGNLFGAFASGGMANEKTVYLIYGQNLIRIEFDLIDRDASSENQVIWEFPSGESYYTDLAVTFNDIDAGDAIDLIVADNGSFTPYSSAGQKAFRQNAIIELTKLRLAFNALVSYSDAGYSQKAANLKEERTRILEELSELKRQPHDALSM